MGKSYACRKDSRDSDNYPTPCSLVWVASRLIEDFFEKTQDILEPCCGIGQISKQVAAMGYNVVENDIRDNNGLDYLQSDFREPQVITNPPFCMFDDFINKAKSHAHSVMSIGRLNYLGTASRSGNGLWDGLCHIACFNRYVDYRTPERSDGKFHVGAMATAWFFWKRGFNGMPTMSVLDVNKYAVLGNYKASP